MKRTKLRFREAPEVMEVEPSQPRPGQVEGLPATAVAGIEPNARQTEVVLAQQAGGTDDETPSEVVVSQETATTLQENVAHLRQINDGQHLALQQILNEDQRVGLERMRMSQQRTSQALVAGNPVAKVAADVLTFLELVPRAIGEHLQFRVISAAVSELRAWLVNKGSQDWGFTDRVFEILHTLNQFTIGIAVVDIVCSVFIVRPPRTVIAIKAWIRQYCNPHGGEPDLERGEVREM